MSGSLFNIDRIDSLMLATLAQAADSNFWMPSSQSTYAGDVDMVFYFLIYLSTFFTLLIAALVVFFAIKYRDRGQRGPHGQGPSHSTVLEVTWTLIPVLLVIVIFLMGFRGFIQIVTPPGEAYHVLVHSQKWNWVFEYPNGKMSDTLNVPVGVPIQLTLTSSDVIHSVFIPAFRIKKDAVPGRYNQAWFEAKNPGTYDLFCAEYCGTDHSQMLAKVEVMTYEDFEAWVSEGGDNIPLPVLGQEIVEGRGGCLACHTTDGTTLLGPSFKDIFGHKVKLTTGESVMVDADYIRESILNPQAKIVAGFAGIMPTYQGLLTEREIAGVIEYLKTISVHYDGIVIEWLPGEAGAESGATEGAAEQANDQTPAAGE